MSLEMNTIELSPKFEGSSSTTAEEIRTYVKALADKLCSLMGLVIMDDLTQEHTYGVRYFLGETGSVYPLMCVGNSDSSSYFYRYAFIGLTNSDKSINNTTISSATINNNYFSIDVRSNPCKMKYYKNETMFLFGLEYNGIEVSSFHFLLTKASTENGEKTVLGIIYSNSIYFSYIPEFGQITGNSSLNLSINKDAIIPYDKECIMSAPGISSVKFPSIYYFSNRINVKAGVIIAKGAEKYLIAYYQSSYSYISLAIKIV